MTEAAKARRGLASAVGAARIGQPLLFALASDVDAGYPPLLVVAADRDPSAKTLLARIAALPGARGPYVLGQGFVDDDGALRLQAAELTLAWLHELAAWTREHIADEPRLGVLAHARFDRTEGRRVVETFERRRLWRGVAPVRPRRGGGQQEFADALRDLPRGAIGRFWLAPDPEHNAGPLITLAAGEDAYDRAVAEARYRGLDRGGHAIAGVVQRLDSGRLTLTSRADPADLAAAVKLLLEHRGRAFPALWELADAPCFRLMGGQLSSSVTAAEPPELSELSQALPSLQRKRGAAFLRLAAEAGALPSLHVGKTREAVEGPGAILGLRFDGDGALVDRPAALPTLAGFVAAWRHRCPPLALLAHARVDATEGATPSPAALWRPLEA